MNQKVFSKKQTKQVIIHAGFHKTASSSIQHSLGYNRKWLLDRGYFYPDLSIDGITFYNQSIPLFGYFCEKPQKFKHYWYHNGLDHVQANQVITNVLEQTFNNHEKIIFSDEFVSTLTQTELETLKAFFQSKGYAIRVISFIREPFNNLVSVVQQRAKAQSPIDETLTNNFLQKFNKRIINIQAVFGDCVEFYNFEKACEHELGPVGFFFELLNLTIEENRLLKVNESNSQQATRLASYVTKHSPLYFGDNEINPIRKREDLLPIFSLPGEKFKLTKDEVDKAMPAIEQLRKEISEVLGDNFLPELKPKFIEKVDWSEKDIKNVVKILPSLDLHINIRIYDYFSIEYEQGKITKNQIKTIGAVVRSRVDKNWNNTSMLLVGNVGTDMTFLQKLKMVISTRPVLKKLLNKFRY